jgi:amino acid transporter
MHDTSSASLQRHFGLVSATALNVTMIVGAGVFVTIPLMLGELPGPWALLGWLVAGLLILVDSLIWSELAAALPGSGGSYLYLLECYGRDRWGRLFAFLFIWQFLLSGPLEVASGLIAMAQFSESLSPAWKEFIDQRTWTWVIGQWEGKDLTFSLGPKPALSIGVGVVLLTLLYRRVSVLGRLTVTFWFGVLAVMWWIIVEGAFHFDAAKAFDRTGYETVPEGFGWKLGAAMILSMYSYLGYYNVCYIGDEVRDPGRTLPHSILLSAALVVVLFTAIHLALLGTISWRDVPADMPNLPATFMRQVRGEWAAQLVTLLLIWSCIGGAFAALLGYSRIPYGAAHYGHFFSILAKVHSVHRIPHISLLAVGGLTLFWCFFNLESVINALITTRIVEQFVAQAIGVMLLRRTQPEMPRPFRVWLYPLPCLLALAGWLYLYVAAGPLYIALGLITLAAGVVVFLLWSLSTRRWPFTTKTI